MALVKSPAGLLGCGDGLGVRLGVLLGRLVVFRGGLGVGGLPVCLAVCLAVGAGALRGPLPRSRSLLLALAGPVVGVVEALALEVHGGGVEDALNLDPGLGVLLQGVLAEGLHLLEGAAVGASVLVDRHWHSDYTSARRGAPGLRGS